MICRGVNPIFAGPAAVTVMVFYNFVPFAIVAGAPDYLARLRLFLILSSVLLIAFGAYQTWRAKAPYFHAQSWRRLCCFSRRRRQAG